MGVIVVDEQRQKVEGVEEHKTGVVQVFFVLDETGSMSVIKQATINGFNEYIQTLKAKTEDVYMTLLKFNSCTGVQMVFGEKHLVDVPELTDDTYRPTCNTPLYDAIGEVIHKAEAIDHNSNRILVIIQTDGEENSSREYTHDAIRSLIKEKESKDNWTFTCIGADIDAWSTIGQSLGFAKGNVLSYAGGQTASTFSRLAGQTVMYCCGNASKTDTFFDTNGTAMTGLPKKKKHNVF